jgi:peptide/nickel transport system permease protein
LSTLDFNAELAAAGANVKSRWGAVRFFIRRYPLGAAGAVIIGIFLFAAAFAPFLTMYDPLSTNAAASLAKPGAAHWLGCDFMGRDVYSRIMYGARISLEVSLGSMLLGSGIGVTVGLLSGYLLGWFDLITQRVLEMMQALPLLVMAIIMAAALGPSLHNTIIAIAIPLVPYVARVIRSSTLSLREQPFVEAAKAIGMSETRIAIRHVLPNTLSPLIVLATAQLGSAFQSRIPPGAGCCRNRRPNTCAPRRGWSSSRGWLSLSLCSAPISWEMPCATCSIHGNVADR